MWLRSLGVKVIFGVACGASAIACSLLRAGVLDAASAEFDPSSPGVDARADDADAEEDTPADVTMPPPPEPDGGAGGDGGTIEEPFLCDPPKGGAPCDPGVVGCGTVNGDAECDTRRFACCTDDTAAAECADPASARCTATFSSSIACNEAADCPKGMFCFGSFAQLSQLRTRCVPALPGGGYFQVCRSNSECPLRNCQVQTCFSAVVQACGGTGHPNCY